MSKIKLYPTKNFNKVDILSYVAQLGTRVVFRAESSCPTLQKYDIDVDVKNQTTKTLHQYRVIRLICRKLDVMGVEYEVSR